MEPHSDESRPSAVADAIGGAAVSSARYAARAWRGRLETAVEELMSTPEMGRVVDRALAGALPEEVARSLVRHRVAERVVRELAASGELERLVDSALASPETLVLVDRVLAIALVADALAILTVSLAVGAAAGLVGALVGGIRPHWLAGTLLGLAGAAIAVGYFTLFWQTAGQTPGMRLMHVRVLPGRADRRITVWRALVRTLGLALAIVPCFLGFVPALFDSRRRALPDYLAGTVVVYDDGARQA